MSTTNTPVADVLALAARCMDAADEQIAQDFASQFGMPPAEFAAMTAEQQQAQLDSIQGRDEELERALEQQAAEYLAEQEDEPQVVWRDGAWLSSDDGLSETQKCVVRYPDATFAYAELVSERGGDPGINCLGDLRSTLEDAIQDAKNGRVSQELVTEDRSVAISGMTLNFTLPDDFGQGWGYTNVILYGASEAYAGSYKSEQLANFAHEALLQLPEIDSSYLEPGLSCNVDVKVDSLADAAAIQERLQAVVDAFKVRPDRMITVRGSHFYDSKVTEYEDNGSEVPVVNDMGFLNYLAKYVPLAEKLPALTGHDLSALCSEADEHLRRSKTESPSLGM